MSSAISSNVPSTASITVPASVFSTSSNVSSDTMMNKLKDRLKSIKRQGTTAMIVGFTIYGLVLVTGL